MPIETHDVSLRGVSGRIFWSLALAVIFYAVGFGTNGWESYRGNWLGLWATCSSPNTLYANKDWFKATQGVLIAGLVLLGVSFLLIFLYMFVHAFTRCTLIKIIAVFCFLAVACMLTGFIIFGKNHDFDLHWSFGFCVVGSCFCLIAAILSIVQLRQ